MLSKERLFSKSQKMMSEISFILRILVVLENSATRETGSESSLPFSTRLFGLKNVGLILRKSDCSFSDPYCPTEEWTANTSHLLNKVYDQSVTLECQQRPLGDLVVPMGWRWFGSVHWFSFLLPHFTQNKGLKGDSASSYSQGPT